MISKTFRLGQRVTANGYEGEVVVIVPAMYHPVRTILKKLGKVKNICIRCGTVKKDGSGRMDLALRYEESYVVKRWHDGRWEYYWPQVARLKEIEA